MQSPFAFNPDQPVKQIGSAFGTPFAIQGWSWLPLNQLLVGGLFTWQSVKQRTAWPWHRHLALGVTQMVVLLGSEWCHNLTHVAAARAVDKPVDVVRVLLGMPVLIYHQPEHPSITPRQHLLRSAAGPVCNACLWMLSKLFQLAAPVGSPTRAVADTAVGMNTFIAGGSLVPVPAFDGGPILKWSLIGAGLTPAQAARIGTQAQKVVGAGLLGSAGVAIRKKHWFLALILSLLGLLSLLTGLDKTKE